MDALGDEAPDYEERIRQAMENTAVVLEQEPPPDHPWATHKRLVFLGSDNDGIALEVIAVEPASESLMVIHAMKLRPRFKRDYEEARKCRR